MRLESLVYPNPEKPPFSMRSPAASSPTGAAAARLEVHTAVVDVPDPRVDTLSAMFNPKKTIYAKVTYADIAGLDGSAGKSGISGTLLNQLTQMDGFIHVVRCFEDDEVPHAAGSIDPQRDIAAMDSEFILNDLIAVERKLERLAEERKKGAGREKAVIEREHELFERFHAVLSEEKPLRDMEISQRRRKCSPGYGFLSPQTDPDRAESVRRAERTRHHLYPQAQPGRVAAGQAGNGYCPAPARRRCRSSCRNTASKNPA